MSITFDPQEYYDINKSVIICGGKPPEDPIDLIMLEMSAFAKSLEIEDLKIDVQDVVSGGMFHKKSHTKCHIVEIEHNDHTMRMLTSATIIGKVVSIYSYESCTPLPGSLELDYAGGPMVDAITSSLKRLEDVEFFLTMDQIFDFIHDHAVEFIRNCSLSSVHTTSVPMGRVG